MLKLIPISITLLFPLLSSAQYVPGHYLLSDSRTKVYSGNIKVHPTELIANNDGNKPIHFKPEEVLYIKTSENKRFIVAEGFMAPSMNRYSKRYGNTLVELIDSGRLCLTRYNNLMHGSFTFNSASSVSDGNVYIVVSVDSATTLPSYVWTNKGKKLCEALAPYVIERPDLQKLLDDRQIRNESLPEFFHAINSGQPFVKPKETM